MASPYVAGVVALLQESRGGNRSVSADEIRTMLINNGRPFNIFGSEQLESVARQGSGLIDVYQAVSSDTIVSPEQIRLNDVEHGAVNNEYTFTIKNNGRLATEYVISHMVASTAQGFEQNPSAEKIISPLRKPIVLSNHEVEAIVEIPQEAVTVNANEEASITVRIQPPANSADIPPSIYSGYIVVTKNYSREDVIYVPYAGITASLSKLPVLVVNSTMPSLHTTHINIFSPALLSFQLAEASPLITISAVSVDQTQNFGVIPGGRYAYVGRSSIDDPNDLLVTSWYGNVATTPEQATLGTLRHSSPHTYDDLEKISKTSLGRISLAQVGTKLQTGSYKLKVMVLRPFGYEQNEADYDIWYSPEITLD